MVISLMMVVVMVGETVKPKNRCKVQTVLGFLPLKGFEPHAHFCFLHQRRYAQHEQFFPIFCNLKG